MTDYTRIFEEARTGLRAAVEAAREELAEVEERRSQLQKIISEGDHMLGYAEDSLDRRLTLHEAIAVVLEQNDNRWMTTKELANEVNSQSLYFKRDMSPVEPNQIHARAKNYPHMFEKDRQRVRLRQDGAPADPAASQRPSKYDALETALKQRTSNRTEMSFVEIADVVGGLPKSAYEYREWWANQSAGTSVQSRSWMSAGWLVDSIDLSDERAVFRRGRPKA